MIAGQRRYLVQGVNALTASTPLLLLRTLLKCLGKSDKRHEERDQSGQELHEINRSVMGITSRRMEGAARHMELPSTTAILLKRGHKYEYMFDNNSNVIPSNSSLS